MAKLYPSLPLMSVSRALLHLLNSVKLGAKGPINSKAEAAQGLPARNSYAMVTKCQMVPKLQSYHL